MIYFLLPPSEWKNPWWVLQDTQRSFVFDLPFDIATSATEKDLKCSGKRYEEGMMFNKNIKKGAVLPAIERYSGVMFKAIDYVGMSDQGQQYFDNHFLILSGMYGLLAPQDLIGNYKLPITTWLKNRRWSKITDTLIWKLKKWDTVVDLLSGSYQKMIDRKKIEEAEIEYKIVDFLKSDGTKHTHGVKKVKGEWVKERCISKAKN